MAGTETPEEFQTPQGGISSGQAPVPGYDRQELLAQLYKYSKQGLLNAEQQAVLDAYTKAGAFTPPPEPPGLGRRILTTPGVLPTAGGLVGFLGANPALGIVGGEILRQSLLSQQAPIPADMPQQGALAPLARLATNTGQALQEPGVLPAAATAGLLPFASQAPGIGAALGRTAVGASGATLGEMGRRELTGNPMTPEQLPAEAGLNTAIQGAVEVAPEVARTLLARSSGGRTVRSMAAAQEAEGMPEAVYHPVDRQTVDQQFALVRASGDQIQPSALRSFLRGLSPEEERTLLRQVRSMESGPNFPQGLGGRLAANIDAIAQGTAPTAMDIGELQQLRSQLRLQADRARNGATADLLYDFQRAVDTAIDSGATTGSGAAPLLREARANYARYRAADDLGALITKYSRYQPGTSAEPGTQVLNLAGLRTELEQATSGLGQSVRENLQRTPGAWETAQQSLNDLGRFYERIPMPDVSGGSMISMARRVMAEALLSDRGTQMLTGFLAHGNGTVTAQQLSILGALLQHEALVGGRVRQMPTANAMPSAPGEP